MKNSRRKFIQNAGALSIAGLAMPVFAGNLAFREISSNEIDIKSLFSSNRGDVWPSTSYQIASGLAAYGHTELAATIADKNVENVIKNGLSEHYDSVTGQPLGVRDYCMAATIATMMLDGLTKKYKLELKAKK